MRGQVVRVFRGQVGRVRNGQRPLRQQIGLSLRVIYLIPSPTPLFPSCTLSITASGRIVHWLLEATSVYLFADWIKNRHWMSRLFIVFLERKVFSEYYKVYFLKWLEISLTNSHSLRCVEFSFVSFVFLTWVTMNIDCKFCRFNQENTRLYQLDHKFAKSKGSPTKIFVRIKTNQIIIH